MEGLNLPFLLLRTIFIVLITLTPIHIIRILILLFDIVRDYEVVVVVARFLPSCMRSM